MDTQELRVGLYHRLLGGRQSGLWWDVWSLANTAVLTRSRQHRLLLVIPAKPWFYWYCWHGRGEAFLQVQWSQCELCQWWPPFIHPVDPSLAALAASLVRAGLSGCSCEFPVRRSGLCLLLLLFFLRVFWMHFLKCTSCSQEGFDLVNLFIYTSICCVKMLERAFVVA